MLGDIIIVGIFWVIFLVWIAYLVLAKKGIKQHMHQISTAGFFLAVMSFVYWLILG
jgi:hypothetical protein